MKSMVSFCRVDVRFAGLMRGILPRLLPSLGLSVVVRVDFTASIGVARVWFAEVASTQSVTVCF